MFTAVALTAIAAGPVSGSAPAPVRSVANGCHTVTPATYNRLVDKLDRITHKKHHRAKRKVCKHGKDSPYVRIKQRLHQVCAPRLLVTGRTSIFDDHTTASGISADEHEGLAVNLRPGTDAGYNNPTTRRWMNKSPTFLVKLLGRSRYTKAIDTGPAGWTGRALDFSVPLARAMGWISNFPTDSIGRLYVLRPGCR